MTQIPNNNMESLPKQFVSAMRTLFDIMDDKHTGYVKLTDIENRWRDDRTKGLPRGVIESLQKVTAHDGLLTFERFCTGLKICLLQNQVDNVESYDEHQLKINKRPPSAPILDDPVQQRTSSMPQLLPRKEPMQVPATHDIPVRMFGPPKPPRLEKLPERKEPKFHLEREDIKKTFDSVVTMGEFDRGLGDGRSAVDPPLQMRKGTRRREPRRHTLHNGVDYNLLKRMKQIEQEKDVLIEGLTAVEEAREWYIKQLGEVQEKIRYAGRMGTYVEPWSEAQQERIELLRARVLELNRQLGALAAGWRRGPLSLHMNLALPITESHQPNLLRSQNKTLSEEVNQKNEKINTLEREKSALIRELLLQRSRSKMLENYS